MTDLLYSEVPYKDIIEHGNQEGDQGQEVIGIANNIPNSKMHRSGIKRVKDFVNNYIYETATKEALNLNFNADDHEVFHTGGGEKKPDFVDNEGMTYELKSSRNLEVAPSYDSNKGGGADVHLVYNREDKHLYIQNINNYTDLGTLDCQEVE